MKHFDIENTIDRNTVLSSFLTGEDKVEDKKKLIDLMLSSEIFPEYQKLIGGKGSFFSRSYIEQHLNLAYPLEDIEMVLGDVLIYYEKEYDFRKKKRVIKNVLESCENIELNTLSEVQQSITDAIGKVKSIRKFEGKIDGRQVYIDKKNKPLGILTGIETCDNVIHGLEYGLMLTVFGAPGSGKTTLLMNLLYQAISSGYNSVFFTLEVPREFAYLMLLSIHSYREAVELGQEPVTYQELLKGSLSDEREDYVFNVVETSLKKLPGKHTFVEFDDIEKFDYISINSFLSNLAFESDVLILDYIQQLLPYVGRDRYEGGQRLVRDWARLGIGKGSHSDRVIIIGSQANREGWKEATKNRGQYSIEALAEINQLERESSYIISLFTDDDLRQSGETKVCLLKHRQGEVIISPILVSTNYKYMVIGDFAEKSGITTANDIEDIIGTVDIIDLI